MKRGVRGVTKSLRTLSTIYVFCEDQIDDLDRGVCFSRCFHRPSAMGSCFSSNRALDAEPLKSSNVPTPQSQKLKLHIPGSADWFFDKADADNNDSIDLEELKAVFDQAGLKDVDVDTIFKKCDKQETGAIHRNEWTVGFHAYMHDLGRRPRLERAIVCRNPISRERAPNSRIRFV